MIPVGVGGMLSGREQQQWQDLAERLLDDQQLSRLHTQLMRSQQSLEGSDAGGYPDPMGTGRHLRTVGLWFLVAVVLVGELGMGMWGAAAHHPVIGLTGTLILVVTIVIPIPLLFDRRAHRG